MQRQQKNPLVLTLEQLTTDKAPNSATTEYFCSQISVVQMISLRALHMHANLITGNGKQ